MQTAIKQKTKSLGHQQRRAMLLEILPTNGFNIADAARKVGYSASYADKTLPGKLKADVVFNRELTRLRAINLSNSTDVIATADKLLHDLIDGPTLTPSLKLKGLELVFRRYGALSDRQVIEDADRAEELTQAQRDEAARYAKWSLSERNKVPLQPNKAG